MDDNGVITVRDLRRRYSGTGAALAIGAIAGLYPSMRAACLSPTEALRTV